MSKHILIVDDSDTCRRIIRLFLESQLEFEVCGEASDAWTPSKKREVKPDLVVLDLAMVERLIRPEDSCILGCVPIAGGAAS